MAIRAQLFIEIPVLIRLSQAFAFPEPTAPPI